MFLFLIQLESEFGSKQVPDQDSNRPNALFFDLDVLVEAQGDKEGSDEVPLGHGPVQIFIDDYN